jgi:hypothetical protein
MGSALPAIWKRALVIERHDRRPAACAFECPHATLKVREIGGVREVLLSRILESRPAAESLDGAVWFCFGEVLQVDSRSSITRSTFQLVILRARNFQQPRSR